MNAIVKARFQPRFKVAGFRLWPYCIGHAVLLHALGNPCAELNFSATAPPGMGSTAQALLACSMPWDLAARRLGGRMGGARLCLAALRILTESRRLAALQGLADYFNHAWSCPESWSRARTDTPTLSESLGMLVVRLRTEFRLSEAQAMSTPVRQALADVMGRMHMEGQCELVTEGDLEMFRLADELKEELQAERAQAETKGGKP